MNANTRKSILVILLVIFAAILLSACGDDLYCPNGPAGQCYSTPNVNPANIVMGDKSAVEQAVGDFLAGDNPQNILSGGNP